MAIEDKAREDSVRMKENSGATEMAVLVDEAGCVESESTLIGAPESLAVELTMLVGNTIEGCCAELTTLERTETTEDSKSGGVLEGAFVRGGTEEGMDDGTSEVMGGTSEVMGRTEVGIEDGKSVDTGGKTLVTCEAMLLITLPSVVVEVGGGGRTLMACETMLLRTLPSVVVEVGGGGRTLVACETMLLRTLPSVVVEVGGGGRSLVACEVTLLRTLPSVVVEVGSGGRTLVACETILLRTLPSVAVEVGGGAEGVSCTAEERMEVTMSGGAEEVTVSGGAEEVVVGGERTLVIPRALPSMSPEEDAEVEVGGTDIGASDVGVEDVSGSDVGAEDVAVSDVELALDNRASGVGFVELVSTDVAGRRLVTAETALLAALFTSDVALVTTLTTPPTALPASLTTLPAPETTSGSKAPAAAGVPLGAGVIELGSGDVVGEEPDGAADPASGVELGDDELPPPTIPA